MLRIPHPADTQRLDRLVAIAMMVRAKTLETSVGKRSLLSTYSEVLCCRIWKPVLQNSAH